MNEFIHKVRIQNANKIHDIESIKRTHKHKTLPNKNIIFCIFIGMVLSIWIEILSFKLEIYLKI